MSSLSQTTVIEADRHQHIFKWTVVNYSKISKQNVYFANSGRKDPPLRSRVIRFESTRSSWTLYLYPNYNEVDVFFELKKESEDPNVYEVNPSIALCASGEEVVFPANAWTSRIPRDKLLSEPEKYLPNDTLTVCCELTILKRYQSSDVESPTLSHMNTQTALKISRDLTELFASQRCSDLTILCDDAKSKFSVHKAILSARSPFFSNLLHHDTLGDQRSLLTVPDVKAGTMKELLHHIYGKEIGHLLEGDYLDLREAADKFGLLDLKLYCEFMIGKYNDSDTFLDKAINAAKTEVLLTKDFILENTQILKSWFLLLVFGFVLGSCTQSFNFFQWFGIFLLLICFNHKINAVSRSFSRNYLSYLKRFFRLIGSIFFSIKAKCAVPTGPIHSSQKRLSSYRF